MPRKITLESIIDKIEDKAFFYLSVEEQRDLLKAGMIADLYSGKVDYNDRQNFNPFRDVDDLLQGLTTINILADKYKLKESVKENLQAGYEEYGLATEPLLKKYFVGLTKEELTTLNTYATKIDFALKLFLPPTNSKNNFLTITNANNIDFPARRWRTHIYEIFVARLRVAAIPTSREELFNLLKNELLGFYDRLKASKQAKEELQALTFKEVTDRHRKIVKPKIEKVYTGQKDIARIAHCEVLDLISSLNKIEEKENFLGERIILWENEKLRAYITISPDIDKKMVDKFGVFTDKILVESRIRLCEECNINHKGDFTISIPIHIAMVNFGYTPEQAENKDYRHLFIQKITPYLNTLYSASMEEQTNNSTTKFRVLSYFSTKGALTLTFTGAFMALQSKAHTFEYVLRDIARQIPDKKTVEYYLARKLVNNATNKTNIALGREDLLSVQALFDNLDSKGVLAGRDTTAHAEKRKIKRFLEALNWLVSEKIIDIQFLDSNKQPVKPKDMAYYTQNIESLKELMTCYAIPKLTYFIEENRQAFETNLDIRRVRADENAKKKRNREKRKAQKQAQQEQEQEQPQQNRNPFLDVLDALPKS